MNSYYQIFREKILEVKRRNIATGDISSLYYETFGRF